MTRQRNEDAKDAILQSIISGILNNEEDGKDVRADDMRVIATRLAKQWGFCRVPGLPDTFLEEAA